LHCSVNKFVEIFESAMSQGIQFVITWIEGHDLDTFRTYHLKFKSQQDLDLFNKMLQKNSN